MREGAADKLTLVVLRSLEKNIAGPSVWWREERAWTGRKSLLTVQYTLNNALPSSKWFVWNRGQKQDNDMKANLGNPPLDEHAAFWFDTRAEILAQTQEQRNTAWHGMAWHGKA